MTLVMCKSRLRRNIAILLRIFLACAVCSLSLQLVYKQRIIGAHNKEESCANDGKHTENNNNIKMRTITITSSCQLLHGVRLEQSGTGLILRKGSKGKFKVSSVQW